jgi:hypothetical protein
VPSAGLAFALGVDEEVGSALDAGSAVAGRMTSHTGIRALHANSFDHCEKGNALGTRFVVEADDTASPTG